MVKKSIGIDIGRHHIRAVQICQTADGLQIQQVFGSQTRRSTDSPADILRSLTTERGFDRHAEVVVSLPHHGVFFADLLIDSSTLAKVRAGDATAIKDSFPVEAEDAIVQVCSVRPAGDGRHAVLAAAASRRFIEREIALLKEAKIRPAMIDTPIGAVQTAVAANHPEILKGTSLILCADEFTVSVAVTQDGQLLLVRTIPAASYREPNVETSTRQLASLLRSEVQITWRKLFGGEMAANVQVVLVAAPRMVLPLAAAIEEEMGCRVTPVDPYACIARPPDEPAGFNLCVAEGLALRAFAPGRTGRPDFLAAYHARSRPAINPRKELVHFACLGTALLVVWTVGLFLRLAKLESQYAAVKTQIAETFRATLPDEKNIVNPLAQLKQKLDSLRADGTTLDFYRPGHPSPLEVLYVLSTHSPASEELTVTDMLVTADSIRLTGTCRSFTALTQWQHSLEQIPGFRVVEVPSPRKDASTGRVHFSLSLSCGRTV